MESLYAWQQLLTGRQQVITFLTRHKETLVLGFFSCLEKKLEGSFSSATDFSTDFEGNFLGSKVFSSVFLSHSLFSFFLTFHVKEQKSQQVLSLSHTISPPLSLVLSRRFPPTSFFPNGFPSFERPFTNPVSRRKKAGRYRRRFHGGENLFPGHFVRLQRLKYVPLVIVWSRYCLHLCSI